MSKRLRKQVAHHREDAEWDIAVPAGAGHRSENGKGRCIMKKRDWKRSLAFVCATALIAGSLSEFGPLTRVKAEEMNLFTDGDMGDDSSDLWTAGNWKFEETTWKAADTIKYDPWAAYNDTASGLGINYGYGDGTVSMYQTIASLDAGNYTVTGWIKDTKSKTGKVTVYHGENTTDTASLDITSSFQQFTGHFTLDKAETNYKVSFQITSEKGAWVCLDSLSLTKDATDETEETPAPESNILYSEDFEDEKFDWTENWSTETKGESKSATGDCDANSSKVWNYYSTIAQNMTATTTVTASEAGSYKASFRTAGENVTGTISLTAGDRKVSADLTAGGWNVYTPAETDALSVEAGTELTITISLDIVAGGYLKIDDILVTKVSDAEIQAAKKVKAEELQSLITEYKVLKETDYTADSWKALQESLTASGNFLQALNGDYTSTTVTEIEEKITNLKKAKDELKSAAVVTAGINVKRVNGLKSDFIGGVDISSYRALKDSGVKYYDFAGNELDDAGFFKLLKDSGINYVRIRVWNNPYDASGNGYGGGNNDLQKAVDMGKLATDAGMRVLIDFHYSDFWADPDKQQAPKAWQNLTLDEKLAKVTEFTSDSLQTLLKSGVDVGMVQVGNETNNGIAGESDWSDGMLAVFAAGCDAVHKVADENKHPIKAVLHFANPESGNYQTYAEKLADAKVNYDVFASSYYPYWHGTLDNLQTQLDTIATTYHKEVMVAETSWATSLEDGDGHANTVREGNNDEGMSYDFSIYGQAKELREVINTIANTTNGIGVFYWEPAWLPVAVYDQDATNAEAVLASNRAAWEKYGSGWASSYAGEYDAKDAGKWYGGSAIDNQALFDASGHPLETLKIFQYVQTGAAMENVCVSTVQNAETQEIDLGGSFTLPESIKVTYSDASEENAEVTWNQADTAAVQTNVPGTYTVTGTVVLKDGEHAVKCKVIVNRENLLRNPGFEEGTESWNISGSGVSVKADAKDGRRGNGYLHFFEESAGSYEVTQTIWLDAGIYTFGGHLQGGDGGENDRYEICVTVDGKTQTAEGELNGWKNWSNPEVQNIEITKDGTKVTVGIRATASAKAWGSWDDMYLNKTGEVTPAPVVTPHPTATPAPATAPETESSSADKETSAPVQTVDWNTVTSNVQAKIAEVTQNPNINSVNMNIVCSGETRLPAAVLGSIKGSDVTLALHSGNGVTVSISGQDLKGTALNALQNIDLTVDSNAQNIPAAMAASKKAEATKQLSVKDTGAFPVAVNIHVNVGAENSGKYANLYRYNAEKKQLEYCGSFPVTGNGQSMFALKQGGDYMVTVTAAQPKESVYFNSGDYAVKAGDTLSAIAKRNHMTLAELKAKNPQIMDLHKIRVGQKLNLN